MKRVRPPPPRPEPRPSPAPRRRPRPRRPRRRACAGRAPRQLRSRRPPLPGRGPHRSLRRSRPSLGRTRRSRGLGRWGRGAWRAAVPGSWSAGAAPRSLPGPPEAAPAPAQRRSEKVLRFKCGWAGIRALRDRHLLDQNPTILKPRGSPKCLTDWKQASLRKRGDRTSPPCCGLTMPEANPPGEKLTFDNPTHRPHLHGELLNPDTNTYDTP